MRYQYKLAARAEIMTMDKAWDRRETVTAIVIMLAEYCPFSMVKAMSEDARRITHDWLAEHCAGIMVQREHEE
jgi:hypothetical protein